MRVLVVGGGGREHALCALIARSPLLSKLYVAPGNVGMVDVAECVDLRIDDVEGLVRFAKEGRIDLTIIGPEAPLVAGVGDAFAKAGLRLFGPSAAAAELEGSKAFARDLCRKHRIPSPDYQVFDDSKAALNYIREREQYPIVLKADGLAAGKGVIIANDEKEATEAVDSLMVSQDFGVAGARLVIEEFLEGTEASMLAIVDGRTIAALEPARDHKRALDYDRGPNTGGMGAISPASAVTPEIRDQVERQILVPTVHAMERAGAPFTGFLYAGLMLTQAGPKVLEFNVRLGDPETQAILPRMKSDLLRLLSLAADRKLDEADAIEWDPRPACCVVVASGGYPGRYERGYPIEGLREVGAEPDLMVFHAGTSSQSGRVVTAGGRVLGVTALGDDAADARARAYRGVERIRFQDAFYRSDIGARG